MSLARVYKDRADIFLQNMMGKKLNLGLRIFKYLISRQAILDAYVIIQVVHLAVILLAKYWY